MANLDLIRGRQVVVPLLNQTGGAVIAGDVVIVDSANDEAFKTTTTVPNLNTVGIVQEDIAALGVGRVLLSGYAPLVNVDGPVTRGHYLHTAGTVKEATGSATRTSASAGQFLTAGATPSAILWSAPGAEPGSTGATGPAGPTGSSIRSVNLIVDGGGSVIVAGTKADVVIPFAWTNIPSVTMLADQTGSIIIDIYKDTYANFPPVLADKITASAPPTISAAQKSQDTTLTGWTKTGAAGDTLRFVVPSAVTSIQRCTICLHLTSA